MYLNDSSTEIHLLPLVAGAILVSWVLYTLGTAIYNVTLHPLAKYPGPKLWAAFWWPDTLSAFTGHHVKDTYKLHQTYGQVVRLNPNTLSFTDGRVWKDVYGFRPGKGQMAKDPSSTNRDVAENFSHHIINSNDADHSRYRRALSHAFSDHALREQEPILNEYFNLLMTKLDDQKSKKIDFVGWYNYATFDIIGDLALADSFHALEGGKYHPWILSSFKTVKFLRWYRLAGRYPFVMNVLRTMTAMMPSIRKSRATHFNYTEARVDNRLKSDVDRKDFMNYILAQGDEKGMSRTEMIANLAVILIAGSETTATLLSGATYKLLQNPEKLAKLQAEVRGAFDSTDEITLTSSSQLPYLQAVIEESLRLYPPVPDLLFRTTPPEGAEVAGHWVPGNTALGVHHWSTYRDPENFTDPDSFAPERWLHEPPARYANDNRQALQPFSFGPRNCIGKNLAYNEMRSILARVIYQYDIELCPESQDWMNQKVFLLWEKNPLYVRLHQRAEQKV